jgi:hypothetical protein
MADISVKVAVKVQLLLSRHEGNVREAEVQHYVDRSG